MQRAVRGICSNKLRPHNIGFHDTFTPRRTRIVPCSFALSAPKVRIIFRTQY